LPIHFAYLALPQNIPATNDADVLGVTRMTTVAFSFVCWLTIALQVLNNVSALAKNTMDMPNSKSTSFITHKMCPYGMCI
jgi:hypothetical protein